MALAPLLVAGCGKPAPLTAPIHPSIVSLNLCADEILAAVAAPGQLLAVSHYSHDPRVSSLPRAEARRLRATSGTVEEIVALRPDLVVGDSFTPPATRGALGRLGVRFVALPIASTVAQSKAQVRALARIARRPAQGEALVGKIERGLARAQPASESPPIPAIVWQGGGLVAGDRALVAELLRRTGFANAAAARGLGQGAVLPLEAMLADPPRLILAAGNPGAEDNRLLHHPALARLPGVARAPFDLRLLYCGGPTIPRAAARLAALRRSFKPLPFRGGVGVGDVRKRDGELTSATPDPSPKGEGR